MNGLQRVDLLCAGIDNRTAAARAGALNINRNSAQYLSADIECCAVCNKYVAFELPNAFVRAAMSVPPAFTTIVPEYRSFVPLKTTLPKFVTPGSPMK